MDDVGGIDAKVEKRQFPVYASQELDKIPKLDNHQILELNDSKLS